jgi:transcriptional/translational regulatory protein YebC/TACO1
VIDAGAEDAFEEDAETVVYTAPGDLAKVKKAIEDAGVEVLESEITFVPNNNLEISEPETARKVVNLMDALEDLEDVINTYTNFDIPETISV